MEDLDVSVTEDPVSGCWWWGKYEPSALSAQISIALNKDEPDTPLTALMKTKGAEKIREALGSYVGFLKSGLVLQSVRIFARKAGFNLYVMIVVQSSRREWSCPQPTVSPRLRAARSPKPRWIKCRWVPTTSSSSVPKLFTVAAWFSLQRCSEPHETLFLLVVSSRFHPRAAQLLQPTPAWRFPPVNSLSRTSSSPHQQTSTGSSSTRRWAYDESFAF